MSDRADRELEGSVERGCDDEMNQWFADFAPHDCEGPGCLGEVPLASMPSCGGAVDGYFWHREHVRRVQISYRVRYEQAWSDYISGPHSAPLLEEYDRFVERAAPSEEELRAHQLLLAVPRRNTGFQYDQWFTEYDFTLSRLATALDVPEVGGTWETNGRRVCGTPAQFEEVNRRCGEEPVLYLNPGEAEMMALLLEAMPRNHKEDGTLDTWTEAYYGYLTKPTQLLFEFPLELGPTLAAYELEFYEWARRARPAARGEQDSDAWMGSYLTLLEFNRLDVENLRLQVDLYEASAPSRLLGLSTYETWLTGRLADLDIVGGYASLHTEAEKLERLLQVKPCLTDPAQLEEARALFDEAREALSLGAAEAAAPILCGDETEAPYTVELLGAQVEDSQANGGGWDCCLGNTPDLKVVLTAGGESFSSDTRSGLDVQWSEEIASGLDQADLLSGINIELVDDDIGRDDTAGVCSFVLDAEVLGTGPWVFDCARDKTRDRAGWSVVLSFHRQP